MSTETDCFAAKLLCSLPPMERRDLESAVVHIQQLDSSVDNKSFWKKHADRTCMNRDHVDTAVDDNSLIEHIRVKLSDYQSRYSDKGVTARFSVMKELDDGASSLITVKTYAEHLDDGNCSAGAWSAVWRINILTEKEAELSGSVALHAHSFEGGSNVQTRATKEFVAAAVSTEEELVHSLVAKFEKNKMSYAEQLADRIVEKIGDFEKQLHTGLSNMFENELEAALRKIRRILPVTKTRFKWDSAAQKNVKLLNMRQNETI